MITVLGKLKDTQRLIINDKNYNILLESPDWTPEKNTAWIQEAVERGDSFLLLGRADGYYAAELKQLFDLLVAPSPVEQEESQE